MEQTNEEKEINKTSWPLLLLVTGLSLIGFSFVMKFLEGKQNRIMFWAGCSSLLLSLLLFLGSKPTKPSTSINEKEG
jgi:hypothetical protein